MPFTVSNAVVAFAARRTPHPVAAVAAVAVALVVGAVVLLGVRARAARAR